MTNYDLLFSITSFHVPRKPVVYKGWVRKYFDIPFQKFVGMASCFDKAFECPLSLRPLYTREYAGIAEGEEIPIKYSYYKYHFVASEKQMKQLYKLREEFFKISTWKEFRDKFYYVLNDLDKVLSGDQVQAERK